MRIAIVVYDHTDEKTIALANDFISQGHCVKFVYFKRNNADKLPKDAILTVLNCNPSIFAALNPVCGLRKWTWAMYRWGDTDLVICPDKKIQAIIHLASKIDRTEVPITIQDKNSTQEYIHFAKKNYDRTHTVPKLNLTCGAKVLIVEIGSIGDISQRFADIKLLKEKNQNLKFWLLVKPPFGEYAKSQSIIDGVIEGNKSPNKILLQTAKKIRHNNFSAMTSLSFAGGHSKIMQFLCFIPKRLPLMKQNRFRDRILLEVPNTATESTKQKISALSGKKIFVCVGAGGSSLKQWRNDYWADFLAKAVAEGWKAVFCGNGENEKRAVDEITQKLPAQSFIDLVDQTKLTEITWIASQCQMCVGNDTGLLHIAALASVPSIGLFSQPTAWRVGLRMPWFYEIHATNEIKKFRWENKDTEYVLDRIKPEEVWQKFQEVCRKHCSFVGDVD